MAGIAELLGDVICTDHEQARLTVVINQATTCPIPNAPFALQVDP